MFRATKPKSRGVLTRESTFAQAGGTHTTGNLYVGNEGDGAGTYVLTGGTLTATTNGAINVAVNTADGQFTVGPGSPFVDAPALKVGTGSGSGVLDVQSITAAITVGVLDFGSNATFTAVPGASIRLNGNGLWNSSTDVDALRGLEDLNLICDGDPVYVEVAGSNGPNPESCTNNFVIDTLTVNGVVVLVDEVDNGNRGGTYGWQEALYVNHLVFGPDGMLYTNALHLYVGCEPPPPDPRICMGSEKGDWDRDCDVDLTDYSEFNACVVGPEVPIPPSCNRADFDDDSDVDLADFGRFQLAFTAQ